MLQSASLPPVCGRPCPRGARGDQPMATEPPPQVFSPCCLHPSGSAGARLSLCFVCCLDGARSLGPASGQCSYRGTPAPRVWAICGHQGWLEDSCCEHMGTGVARGPLLGRSQCRGWPCTCVACGAPGQSAASCAHDAPPLPAPSTWVASSAVLQAPGRRLSVWGAIRSAWKCLAV